MKALREAVGLYRSASEFMTKPRGSKTTRNDSGTIAVIFWIVLIGICVGRSKGWL